MDMWGGAGSSNWGPSSGPRPVGNSHYSRGGFGSPVFYQQNSQWSAQPTPQRGQALPASPNFDGTSAPGSQQSVLPNRVWQGPSGGISRGAQGDVSRPLYGYVQAGDGIPPCSYSPPLVPTSAQVPRGGIGMSSGVMLGSPLLPFGGSGCMYITSGEREDAVGMVEKVASRVYIEALSEGKSVSTEKVGQGTLLCLGVSSFEALGIMSQEIPCLRKLALLEGKVNAFIHSHVAGKKITTLFDLSADLARDEGVKDFNGLGLGPLLCHPLVIHYFSPPAGAEIYKITAGEVIQFLADFDDHGKDTRIQIDSFLTYVATERSVPSPQHLCIRIQSLGMHIGFIRQAKRTENELIRMWKSKVKVEFETNQKASVIDRVTSFLVSEKKKKISSEKQKLVACGKRNVFASCEKGPSHKKQRKMQDESSDDDKEKVERFECGLYASSFTSCPYPSAAEERERLKKQGFEQSTNISEEEKPYRLSRVELAEFVAFLKDACSKPACSISDVVEKMREMSAKCTGIKVKKRRMSRFFQYYPAIGLLNVAVLSVKAGHWDSIYENFDSVQRQSLVGKLRSIQTVEPIDVDCDSGSATQLQASCIAAGPEHLMAEVSDHFDRFFSRMIAGEAQDVKENQQHAWLVSILWAFECEQYLSQQHSVGSFSCLGWGSLPQFLSQNVGLLSSGMKTYFDQAHENIRMASVVPKDRVSSFILQAHSCVKNHGSNFQEEVLTLLCRQFKVRCFKDLCTSPLESLLDSIDGKSACVPSRNHIIFLAPLLLGRPYASDSKHRISQSDSTKCSVMGEAKLGVLGDMTDLTALGCLLKAPVLADLSMWSQWDSVFAPTLGPLLDWLEKRGQNGIFALLTCEGTLVRIDQDATVEGFLKSCVKGCGKQMAALLVSIVALYGGASNVPVALLRSHACKGLETFIQSTPCSAVFSPSMPSLLVKKSEELDLAAKRTNIVKSGAINDHQMKPNSQFPGTTKGTNYIGDFHRSVHHVATIVGHCVLEFLSSVIFDLHIFAAEIVLPALSTLIPTAPSSILNACQTLQDRLVLHSVGLALGIPEWINDYNLSVLGHTMESSCPSGADVNFVTNKTDGAPKEEQAIAIDAQEHDMALDIESEKTPDSKCAELDKTCNPVIHMEAAPVVKSERTKDEHLTAEVSGDMVEVQDIVLEARKVIEEIRCNEFGMGQHLGSSEKSLLARQHARMGRALHRLSCDLYSKDSHFVLELVQNADDNTYAPGMKPTIAFIVTEDRIVMLNNELGFTAANIRALCDVGNSTKSCSKSGYIGHKGIGFKSVFRVTDAPEIHSNGFHVKFDISEGALGFILPTTLPPLSRESSDEILSCLRGINLSHVGADEWRTRVDLPIKSSLQKGHGMSVLAAKFNDLHPSLLLFLQHLRCIVVHNKLTDLTTVMHRDDLGNNLVKVATDKGSATWLVVKKQVEAGVQRAGVDFTEIALAFQLNELPVGRYESQCEQQQVFAFLPLRAYGLRFILQADFVVPSSREEVDCDSEWNQWILSEVPDVFVQAAESFKKTTQLAETLGKAVGSFMSFVPMEGEVLGFFSPLPRMILSRLSAIQCLPVEGGGWALPCLLVTGWRDWIRDLLPDSLLQDHLGLYYLEKEVVLSDHLARRLGLHVFGADLLIAIMKSICDKKGALEPLGCKWIQSWLVALHDSLNSGHSESLSLIEQDQHMQYLKDLQCLPFLPLSNGLFTALSTGPVWFSYDISGNIIGVDNTLKYFPLLLSDLRTLHPLLLTFSTESDIVWESKPFQAKSRESKIVNILQRIGVNQVSAHEILKTHVLPVIGKQSFFTTNTPLVIQYLAFIAVHLQSSCFPCSRERADILGQLRRSCIIFTNNGLASTGDNPLHFGPQLGNRIDVQKIIEGTHVLWNEVSPIYLNANISDHSDATAWRSFFKDLGVTDFFQVVGIERTIKDKSSSLWKNCPWDTDIGVDNGWIVQDWQSPELINLLSEICDSNDEHLKDEDDWINRQAKRCADLLVALDQLWDEYYSQFCKATYWPVNLGAKVGKDTDSGLVLHLRRFPWVLSSLDRKLHVPTQLFERCEAVTNILGTQAPYVLPLIKTKGLMAALGVRTKVLIDDALNLLQHWSLSSIPFETSVGHMNRLYSFLWQSLTTHKQDVLTVLRTKVSIFVPLNAIYDREQAQQGVFIAAQSTYWSDPTHIVDIASSHCDPDLTVLMTPLSKVYHGLHVFFVEECQVPERPNFNAYLSILQSIAETQLPSAVRDQVLEVFALWSEDIFSCRMDTRDISSLKNQLHKVGTCVLPTVQDKWVSLNPSMGYACLCDDDTLGEEFRGSMDRINFICMNDKDLPKTWSKSDRCSLKPLIQALGIPKLSEVVERTVIEYGLQPCERLEELVSWVLPFIQRYMRHHHLHHYTVLQDSRIADSLQKFECVVVDQLFCQYHLNNGCIRSAQRTSRVCLLQGTKLHAVAAWAQDYCSLFMELSRFFFCDKPNGQLGNFLHLITLMGTSSFSESEVESFVVKSQGVPPLPIEEQAWTFGLQRLDRFPETQTLTSSSFLDRHIKYNNLRRKPAVGSPAELWPPQSFLKGGTVHCEDMDSEKSKQDKNDPCRQGVSMTFGEPETHGLHDQHSVVGNSEISRVFHEDVSETLVEENLVGSKVAIESAHFGKAQGICEMPPSERHLPHMEMSDDVQKWIHETRYNIQEPQIGFPNIQRRNFFLLPECDAMQLLTGRAGEGVVFRHLLQKYGAARVKWVNQDSETGAAFDIVIENQDGQKDYIEVKSTRASDKNWFEISPRQWDFANLNKDSFSIVRVIFGSSIQTVKLLWLPNPVKLVQDGIIQLALLLPSTSTTAPTHVPS